MLLKRKGRWIVNNSVNLLLPQAQHGRWWWFSPQAAYCFIWPEFPIEFGSRHIYRALQTSFCPLMGVFFWNTEEELENCIFIAFFFHKESVAFSKSERQNCKPCGYCRVSEMVIVMQIHSRRGKHGDDDLPKLGKEWNQEPFMLKCWDKL